MSAALVTWGASVVLAQEAPDPDTVTPGLTGFLVTFAVALAFLVLVRSFITHLRRVDVNARRAELAEQVGAERAEAAAARVPERIAPEAAAPEPTTREATTREATTREATTREATTREATTREGDVR